MFELTLCLDFERQKYLSDFYRTISPSIKKDAGIIIKHNVSGKSYLVIAVHDSKKEYIKAKTLDFVTNVLEHEFKYKFLKEKIEIKTDDNLNEAFFRAISSFDEEIDRQIISENIEFTNEIVIESLFYFKLQALQKRWENTAKIINQNFIMSNSLAMTEVLRYLCASSDNNTVFVNLFFMKKQVELKNFERSKRFKLNSDGISKLFAEIISLNPMKINVHDCKDYDSSKEITSTLVKVFDDKIYFV